jgi:DNA repair exonuclease SbcCD ATPase subunit
LQEVKSRLSIVQLNHVQAAKDLEEGNQLRALIAEMENEAQRWTALAGDLDALRNQLAALENALTPQQKEARQLEQQVQARARAMIQMREEQLQHLRKPLAALLAETDAREREFIQTSVEARQAQEKYEKFDLQYRQEKKVLELYLEADRKVAEALGGSAEATQLLEHCRTLLGQADEVLARTIEARNQAMRPVTIGFGAASS